jgi:hypothetical protein
MTDETMRYWVDFYDMFDGWIRYPEIDPSYQFDDLEAAKAKARAKQAKLDKNNIDAGEHWGVIDTTTGREIFCLENQVIKK